jgi:DNA-binding MurR/RpiR family transcriptional regulator
MDSLVVTRLSELLPTLPRAEKRVARTLLAEYPLAAHQSIAQLAEQAQVSGPTVLRLAKRLGFDGFPEFREAVWRDTVERQASPLSLYPQSPPADGADVISRSDEVFVSSGPRLSETVDRVQFEAAAALLADHKRRVFTAGGRFTRVVAQALSLHLEILRPGVRHVDTDEQVRCLLDARRGDVLVVFDLRRYQPNTIEFGERAAAAGMTVVLVTDPWMSPLTVTASILLIVPGRTLGPFDSMIPALSLAETLGAAVVDRLWDGTHARMARYDKLWSDRGVGGPTATTDALHTDHSHTDQSHTDTRHTDTRPAGTSTTPSTPRRRRAPRSPGKDQL